MQVKTRVAINGFGRIGRQAFKIAFGRDDLEIVAVNDLSDPETLAYLLEYDSVYGQYEKEVSFRVKTSAPDKLVGELVVDGNSTPLFAQKNPVELPWAKLKVDVVIESTGVFTQYSAAKAHLKAGAKRVVVSAPAKGNEGSEGKTVVLGTEDTARHLASAEFSSSPASLVLSNASCTTNCVSPVIQVLHSRFKVKKAFLTTVHGYTATQNLVDGPNKKLRRGRAAAINIVPSSTGAAVATGHVVPEIASNFDGVALRVPVATGSISDITALLGSNTTVEEVNQAFEQATQNPLFEHVLSVTRAPLVSSDIIGSPYSAIVDLEFTRVVGGNLVKVLAWYDNEWGYSNRLVEVVAQVGKQLSS